MRPKLFVLCIAGVMTFSSCSNKVQEEETEKKVKTERAERDVDNIPLSEMTYEDILIKYNTVAGHDERDAIVGNFTGKGLDTLYVRWDETKEDGERWQFYAESNNKSIPRFNMSGCISIFPKSVMEMENHVERIDTCGLIVLFPQFSTIDLVCGKEPQKSDTSVILMAEAAFTGQCLDRFDHFNIAGNHVSQGKKYKGYRCKRNTGAFVFYNNKWKFCYQNYAGEIDSAAANGGMAFGQELMIFDGQRVKTIRKDANQNQFRALCEYNGSLCIVESEECIPFGDFCKKLLDFGVTQAIYLDMGPGWNHAWYREKDNVVELHPKTHKYCTNWVTFYR